VKPEDPAHIRRPMISTERIIMLTKQVDCRWYPKQLVERGDIWHIRPHRKKRPGEKKPERHQAPFPSEIPRRAILACTEHGMNVLDTFAGTATTLHVASELGRIGHGFELYPPTEAA
jgi:DNA modification methylase